MGTEVALGQRFDELHALVTQIGRGKASWHTFFPALDDLREQIRAADPDLPMPVLMALDRAEKAAVGGHSDRAREALTEAKTQWRRST